MGGWELGEPNRHMQPVCEENRMRTEQKIMGIFYSFSLAFCMTILTYWRDEYGPFLLFLLLFWAFLTVLAILTDVFE